MPLFVNYTENLLNDRNYDRCLTPLLSVLTSVAGMGELRPFTLKFVRLLIESIEMRAQYKLEDALVAGLVDLVCNLMEAGPDTNFKRACLDKINVFVELMRYSHNHYIV